MASQAGGEEEEEGRGGGQRRSTRMTKGVWTATEEGVWLARLQLLPEDDEDRCGCVGRGDVGESVGASGSVEARRRPRMDSQGLD